MKDVRIPTHSCLHCHGDLSAATNVTSNEKPKEGDLSICVYCGHLMAFTKDIALRELTPEEQTWCDQSPVVQTSQAMVRSQNYVHPDKRVLQ